MESQPRPLLLICSPSLLENTMYFQFRVARLLWNMKEFIDNIWESSFESYSAPYPLFGPISSRTQPSQMDNRADIVMLGLWSFSEKFQMTSCFPLSHYLALIIAPG